MCHRVEELCLTHYWTLMTCYVAMAYYGVSYPRSFVVLYTRNMTPTRSRSHSIVDSTRLRARTQRTIDTTLRRGPAARLCRRRRMFQHSNRATKWCLLSRTGEENVCAPQYKSNENSTQSISSYLLRDATPQSSLDLLYSVKESRRALVYIVTVVS